MLNKILKPLDKVYSGNIFERMEGLESLFHDCKNKSILDVGCAEGLICYEFAKHGAVLIHGFEIDRRRVEFANLLFQEVPVKSEFRVANIATNFDKFEKQFSNSLLNQYDITLYLGVYHHLIRQTSPENVHEFISALLSRTATYFAVRTNMIDQFESIILSKGFEVFSEKAKTDTVGQLKIYKRVILSPSEAINQ